MKSLYLLVALSLLSGCVRQSAALPCVSAQRDTKGNATVVSSGSGPSVTEFNRLPVEWRRSITHELGGSPEYELAIDLGKDHLGRTIRLVKPCRYASFVWCGAVVTEEGPLALLPSAYYNSSCEPLRLISDGVHAAFMLISGKVGWGMGYCRYETRVFKIDRSSANLVFTTAGTGYEMPCTEWCYHREFATGVSITTWEPLILTAAWSLDLNEGEFNTEGICDFAWNPDIYEFYPIDSGEYDRMVGVCHDGPDSLIAHHFPALRNWAKAKGQPACDWLKKLRLSCKLESSRVLIDMILG